MYTLRSRKFLCVCASFINNLLCSKDDYDLNYYYYHYLIIAHYWLLIDNIKLILILSEDTIPVDLSALAQGQLV